MTVAYLMRHSPTEDLIIETGSVMFLQGPKQSELNGQWRVRLDGKVIRILKGIRSLEPLDIHWQVFKWIEIRTAPPPGRREWLPCRGEATPGRPRRCRTSPSGGYQVQRLIFPLFKLLHLSQLKATVTFLRKQDFRKCSTHISLLKKILRKYERRSHDEANRKFRKRRWGWRGCEESNTSSRDPTDGTAQSGTGKGNDWRGARDLPVGPAVCKQGLPDSVLGLHRSPMKSMKKK